VILILLGALFLTGLSVALVLRAAAMPRMRASETLETIDAYGYAHRLADGEAAPGVRGALNGVASAIGGLVARHFGDLREAELRTKLMAAGLYRTAPRMFIGYRILCAVCTPAVWVWFSATSRLPVLLLLGGGIFALLAGWAAPMSVLRRRAERRVERIDYELPELIDLLVVTVEAGLGFSSSLQVAAERLRGPLGDEMRLTLQEQSMGLSTNEALRNMLARAETPAMRSFVRSIVQGESLGVSIGTIMRNLALEMRKRRRAAAEERAQKAPIKLLFPLIFLIFPAMFIVLLGPAVFQFIEAFGGGS
jgi:tight adherence protein C